MIRNLIFYIIQIMDEARSRFTGAELKVHESILDSCTELMDLIRLLILASDTLQKEIVEVGRVRSQIKY